MKEIIIERCSSCPYNEFYTKWDDYTNVSVCENSQQILTDLNFNIPKWCELNNT